MSDTHPNEKQRIASPTSTKTILKQFQLSPKKSLGQNFISDSAILDRMIQSAQLNSSKAVIEIGPGIGALTQQLAQVAGSVLAVEIDQRLIPVLSHTLAAYPHVHIVHGDILKINLKDHLPADFAQLTGVSVVANLPYYITTPIIFKLLEDKLLFEYIVIMIQKEVAERLCARPGSKDYGSLSIAIQYYCEPEIVSIVPRHVFVPIPNVDSAIIRLKRREAPLVAVDDEDFFFNVIRNCFTQRRKTILNNLQAKYPKDTIDFVMKDVLAECGIDPMRRAETLSIEEFALLAHALFTKSK
jgi:16S rRNA (adenine1518-N6/adenine1519-N6)-dimethyltransferase